MKGVAQPLGMAAAGNGIIDSIAKVFDMLSMSAVSLTGRLQIEMVAGEMTDFLDRLKYDCLDHRSHKPHDKDSLDPRSFPRRYDRIHMSNIPDYVGGPFTALLAGRPALRTGRPSKLRFKNLLNPPEFYDHDQFLAEYMLLSKEQAVEDHFGMTRLRERSQPLSAEKQSFMKMMGLSPFVAEHYFIWSPVGKQQAIPAKRRMPRPVLEHWLYSHFLKICLPFRRPLSSSSPIHAPLNLTAFFRLVERLHEVGYPAYWLSTILVAISEGSILTTSRSPRQLVLPTDESLRNFPARKINVKPWTAE